MAKMVLSRLLFNKAVNKLVNLESGFVIKSGFILFLALFLGTQGYSQITSVQDGAWNNTTTWDCGCVPTTSDGAITILHLVNVSANTSADQVFVDAFGTLIIDAGITFTVANGTGNDLGFFNDGLDYGYLVVNGILELSDVALIVGTDQANANFNSGSIYRHLYTQTGGRKQITIYFYAGGNSPVSNWK